MGARILIVEDDADIGAELARIIRVVGHDCEVVVAVPEALVKLRGAAYDAVLLDLGLPGEDGISALERVVKHSPGVRVVVLTGRDEAALAIAAIRAGAFDYLVKPWRREVLLSALNRAIAAKGADISARKDRPEDALVGQSDSFRTVIEQARLAAETSRVPVLLCGECGTGKDVIGKEIHRWSTGPGAPFVTINAACLPGTLLESELFGHEAGAFTDAKTSRRGLFEQAHGGTLFLDEIGELPLDLQPKLLRVLEGHPFRRLGGEREIRTDVRLVAATNRRLPEMISRGLFREDLYYRLSVFELVIPPLRERGVDVRELTAYFLTKTARDMGRPTPPIAARALDHLLAYAWPGNVRELRNVIERAVVLSRGEQLDLEHLPVDVRGATLRKVETAVVDAAPLSADLLTLESAMQLHIMRVFEQCGRNLTHASAKLGITRVSLRKRLRAYGIYPVKKYSVDSL
jgi:DNA-binding NtrC family response regulator